MKFTKFTIQNYKGIKELIIDLDKQPRTKILTLVGLNESGKTSILEAINLFQRDIPLNDRHTLIPKGEKISFTGSISIRATLSISVEDNEKISRYAKELGYKYIETYDTMYIIKEYKFVNSEFVNKINTWGYKPKAIKSKAKKPIELEGENWDLITEYIKDYLLPKIVYYPNFLFDFPKKIYIDNYVVNSEEERTYKNVIQDILSTIKSNLNIQEQLLDRMQKTSRSKDESLESTLSKMSAIVTQLIFDAWEKLYSRGNKAIEISYGSEDVDVVAKAVSTTVTRYYLEFKLREGANKFYIHERSLGFKWFFAFLLFTEFRKHRSSDKGEILFLLDEPASNLHSTAQQKLLETFKGLVDKSTLIYTTHSHHLINPEWLSGAYIVRNRALIDINEFDYNVNLTDIEAILYRTFVANNPDQKDYFQPILDTLDYQPGLLEKIPNIITTEGKSDFYTFRYINKLYFNDLYKDLHFYPSTGANTNTPIIALYIAWYRPIVVLLDGDKEGSSAKKAYLNKFGNIIDGSIFSLADIDGSFIGLSLEELFSDDEKLRITKEFDDRLSAYEKGKFNASIQTLLFENRKVNLSRSTLSNFKKIFEFLNKQLITNNPVNNSN